MVNKMLEKLGKQYALSPVDAGEFAVMKVMGMKFSVSSYDAKGLGRVSVMEAKGFLGLMKMDTVVVNPFELDAPLLSYDRIYAFGNDKLYLELFDTTLNGFNEGALPGVAAMSQGSDDQAVADNWYNDILSPSSIHKAGGNDKTSRYDTLTMAFLDAYLDAVAVAPACDPDEKRAKAATYTEGLLTHGGPSTDVFVKKFGKEVTARFFRQVLFGTGQPR